MLEGGGESRKLFMDALGTGTGESIARRTVN